MIWMLAMISLVLVVATVFMRMGVGELGNRELAPGSRSPSPVAGSQGNRADSAVHSTAQGETRIEVISPLPRTDPGVSILVTDSHGTFIPGARVAIGRMDGDRWLPRVVGKTGPDGRLFVRTQHDDRDVSVFAPGHEAWFGNGILPRTGDSLVVRLLSGGSLFGRVATSEGVGLVGVRLFVVTRVSCAWEAPDFVVDSALPGEDAGLAPPEKACYVQEALTSTDGAFEFHGIKPQARVVITLVDDGWVLVPAAVAVEVGQDGHQLTAVRATGIDIECASPSGTEALIAAESGSWSRSFSAQLRDGHARLRFVGPEEDARGISYSVRVFDSGRHFAVGHGEGLVGEVAVVRPAPVATVGPHKIIAQWPDGTLCQNGILVVARDGSGVPVPATVVEQLGGKYLVECGASAVELTVLAKDCWRDLGNAPVLSVEGVVRHEWRSVTMPEGGEVTIIVEAGRPRSVTVAGTFGARVVTVDGLLRLRSLASGPVSASTMRDGVLHKVQGVVAPGSEITLDLSK